MDQGSNCMVQKKKKQLEREKLDTLRRIAILKRDYEAFQIICRIPFIPSPAGARSGIFIHIIGEKSANITFVLCLHNHIHVTINGTILHYCITLNILRVHLNERLIYTPHVRTKQRELDLWMRNLNCLQN